MAPSRPRQRKRKATRKRTENDRFNQFNVFRSHYMKIILAAQRAKGQERIRKQGEWSKILGAAWRSASTEIKERYAEKAEQLNRVDDALWMKARKEKAQERARKSKSFSPSSLVESSTPSAQTASEPSTSISANGAPSLPAGLDDALDTLDDSDDDLDLEYPRVDVYGVVNGARIQALAELGFYDDLPPLSPEPVETKTLQDAGDAIENIPYHALLTEAGPSRIAHSTPRGVQMQGSTAVSALHQGTFAISGSAPNGLLSPFNFPSLLPTQSTSTLPSIVSYGLAPLRPPTTRDNRMMDNTPQAQTHFRGPIFPPQPLGDVRKQTYTSRASLGRYVPYSSSSRTHARAVATQFAGASLPDYGVGYSVHGTAAFTLDNAPSSLGAPVASSSLMPARAISPSMTLDAGSIGQAAQVAHRPHTSSSSRGPGQRAPTFMELLHGDLDLFPDPSEYANPSAPQSAADSRPLQDPDAVSTSYLPYQDNHDSFSDSPSFLTAQLVHSLGGDASAGFESVHTSVSAAPLEQQPFDDDDILSSCIKHDFTTSFVVPPQ